MTDGVNDLANVDGLLMVLTVVIAAYFIPTIIAVQRKHEYRWVILAVNIAGGWTVLAWVGALVWAVWPAEKSIADPVLGNPTGLGVRNTGDTLGAADYGRERGYAEEKRCSEPIGPRH